MPSNYRSRSCARAAAFRGDGAMLSWGARPGETGSASRLARDWWPLALIVCVGAYLRLAHLGDLGFRWDEDLSGLAVRAILEKGVPELPSGMVYLRGGVFSHLMAASAALFGFSEFALRLPAALFGIALIVAARSEERRVGKGWSA